MCPLLSFVLVSESQGGEDGSGAERHRGHRADGHRQHHGALGAPPLLHHKGHISSDLCVCVLNLMAICSIMVLWGHLFVFVCLCL